MPLILAFHISGFHFSSLHLSCLHYLLILRHSLLYWLAIIDLYIAIWFSLNINISLLLIIYIIFFSHWLLYHYCHYFSFSAIDWLSIGSIFIIDYYWHYITYYHYWLIIVYFHYFAIFARLAAYTLPPFSAAADISRLFHFLSSFRWFLPLYFAAIGCFRQIFTFQMLPPFHKCRHLFISLLISFIYFQLLVDAFVAPPLPLATLSDIAFWCWYWLLTTLSPDAIILYYADALLITLIDAMMLDYAIIGHLLVDFHWLLRFIYASYLFIFSLLILLLDIFITLFRHYDVYYRLICYCLILLRRFIAIADMFIIFIIFSFHYASLLLIFAAIVAYGLFDAIAVLPLRRYYCWCRLFAIIIIVVAVYFTLIVCCLLMHVTGYCHVCISAFWLFIDYIDAAMPLLRHAPLFTPLFTLLLLFHYYYYVISFLFITVIIIYYLAIDIAFHYFDYITPPLIILLLMPLRHWLLSPLIFSLFSCWYYWYCHYWLLRHLLSFSYVWWHWLLMPLLVYLMPPCFDALRHWCFILLLLRLLIIII